MSYSKNHQVLDVNKDRRPISLTSTLCKIAEEVIISSHLKPLLLRRDFLESRVFFAKTAQNLATKPSRNNVLPPFSVLKVFQKYLRRKTEFYWIFGYVMRQNIAKYKEG